MATEIRSCLLMLALAVLGAGCGGAIVRPPASFSGVVKLDDQPLKSGSIQFTSLRSGETAFANLDSAGRFRVEFPEADLGTDYQVTVGQPIPAEEVDAIDALTAPPPQIKNNVPAKYANRSTSRLSARLETQGENLVDFDLKTN